MKRLYYSDASDTPPSPPKNPITTQYPQDGNKATKKMPTVIGAYWYHMITEEFMAVIEQAGLEPSITNLHQLADVFADFKERASGAEAFKKQAEAAADRAEAAANGVVTETAEKIKQIQDEGNKQVSSITAKGESVNKDIESGKASLQSKLEELIAQLDATGGEQANYVKAQAQDILDAIKTSEKNAKASADNAAASVSSAASTISDGKQAISDAKDAAVSAVGDAQKTGVSAVQAAQKTATDAVAAKSSEAQTVIANAQKAIDASVSSASASATAASKSASAAKASETNAASSATAAGKSQAAAASSASAAKTSETNAKASETAASGSASAAKTSETNAASSASAAKASETAAGKSASSASASATSASGSAQTATSKASAASDSATAASSSASAASKSASAAATSESNAATSESSASKSATSASGSAAAAASSAKTASDKATAAASSATAAASSASAAKTSETNAAASATSAAKSVADGEQAIADAKTAGVAAVAAQQDTSVKAVQAAQTSATGAISKLADTQADRLSKITNAVVETETHTITDASSAPSFAVGTVSHVIVFVDSVLAVEGQSYGITNGNTVQFADALPVGTEVTLIKFVSAGAAAITPSYAIDSVLSDTSVNAVQNKIVKSAIEAAVKTALLSAHPIGSIYCSVEPTDPGTLFGGTWERIAQGRVLWGADAAHSGGDTIEAGLPNVYGEFAGVTSSLDAYKRGAVYTSIIPGSADVDMGTGKNNYAGKPLVIGFSATRFNAIYGASATVQPPAYVVYMWRRTA